MTEVATADKIGLTVSFGANVKYCVQVLAGFMSQQVRNMLEKMARARIQQDYKETMPGTLSWDGWTIKGAPLATPCELELPPLGSSAAPSACKGEPPPLCSGQTPPLPYAAPLACEDEPPPLYSE